MEYRDKQITVRFTAKEKQLIKKIAKQQSLPVAIFARQAIMKITKGLINHD